MVSVDTASTMPVIRTWPSTMTGDTKSDALTTMMSGLAVGELDLPHPPPQRPGNLLGDVGPQRGSTRSTKA